MVDASGSSITPALPRGRAPARLASAGRVKIMRSK
jgi:hypothetical protein